MPARTLNVLSPDPRMTSDLDSWAPPSYNGGEEGALERQFDVVIERDEEGYYVASVPQLPGCHTQAQSLDSLMERIREAIELCLEVQGAPSRGLEFVGVQRVTIAAGAGSRG